MKTLFIYLRNFINEDFHVSKYISAILFCAAMLWLNMEWKIERYIHSQGGQFTSLSLFFLLYASSFYLIILIQKWTGEKNYFNDIQFWKASLLTILLISVYVGFRFPYYFITRTLFSFSNIINYSIYVGFLSLFGLCFCTLVYRYMYKRHGIWGMFYTSRKHRNMYLFMFLCVFMITYIASQFGDIKTYYPRYTLYMSRDTEFHELWLGMYEFCYAIGFVNVEVVFRGMLVIFLAKYMGKDIILPATVVYCFVHFGKPLTEAVSSFFGGYILSVISYRTQSILGGIILHISMAWSMEFFGYIA